MTDNIVARLRASRAQWTARAGIPSDLETEAADEIERLRHALRLLVKWHDDTNVAMLDVFIDVARVALREEKTDD